MNRALIALLTPLIFLGACGGSSDSDGGQNNNPPPVGSFDIDGSNALAVTAITYQAVVQSGETAGLAGSIGADGGGGGLAKTSFERKFSGVLQSVVKAVPLPPIEYPCLSGTVTFTFDVVDPLVFATGVLSVGDTILIEYVDCDEGLGEVIDGTIDATVDAFDGDITTGAYLLTMTMNLTDLQVDFGSDLFTSNGDATVSLDTRVSLFVSASVSGTSMTTDSNTSSETLTEYSSAETLDLSLNPTEYTMNATGNLNSSQLDGIVVYSTPVEFLGFDLNNPHQGELLVTSDNGSARLIAQANAIDVVIEIYASNDGTGDPTETINTTWAELAAM